MSTNQNSEPAFPSERKPPLIEVFQQRGDPIFICGVHGWITGDAISDIENEMNANRDEDLEEGVYLYEIHREGAQVGDEGRIELPAYWDLTKVGYKSFARESGNQTR